MDIAFSLSLLENHSKAYSIFGEETKMFVGVAKSNQVHSEAAWGKLGRSQAKISMARIQLGEVSERNNKNTFF